MPRPVRKVNTFMQSTSQKLVDSISRFFIIIELIFGVYRISVLPSIKKRYLEFALVYILIVNGAAVGVTIKNICHMSSNLLVLLDPINFITLNFVNFILRKRVLKFYEELNEFDKEIGYEETMHWNSIQNLIQMAVEFVLSFTLVFVAVSDSNMRYYFTMLLIMYVKILHALEFHYFGHLIGMIPPRVRRITYHIKVSYPLKKNDENNCICNSCCDEEFNTFQKRPKKTPRLEMETLMDRYYDIIKIYDYLIEAIKWQIILLLIVTCVVTLVVSYVFTSEIINQDFIISHLWMHFGYAALELAPIIVICLFGDQVCKEVHLLRETLSCALYENNLDKPSRTAANAFMMLTEARDLSFSLFHMFNLDISLPFKFLGLILTYLIILLQFDKVINPKTN